MSAPTLLCQTIRQTGARQRSPLGFTSVSISAPHKKQERKTSCPKKNGKKKKKELLKMALPPAKLFSQLSVERNERSQNTSIYISLSSRFSSNLLSLGNHLFDSSNHVKWLFWKVIVFSIQHSLLHNSWGMYQGRATDEKKVGQKTLKWNEKN